MQTKKVFFDFEQVFDVWSLLFCISRQVICQDSNLKRKMGNEDYKLIVSASIKDAIQALADEFDLTDGQTSEISSTFEKLLKSVTPWIPYIQVIKQFESQGCKVQFVSSIEEQYYRSILKTNGIENEVVAEREIGSIIFTSDQKVLGPDVIFLNPRKLKQEGGYDEITQVPLKKKFEEFKDFEFITTKKYVDPANGEKIIANLPEFKHWGHFVELDAPVEISGNVVQGFQRGSKQLGVPTANIEMTPENIVKAKKLVPGVYSAKGILREKEYACALSVGWNPVYDNPTKTVEVYVLSSFDTDFYGEHLSVVLSNFLRAEALFSGFDELILAIQSDIEVTRQLVKIDGPTNL